MTETSFIEFFSQSQLVNTFTFLNKLECLTATTGFLTLTNQVRFIELIAIIIFVYYSSFSIECHEVKKKRQTILGFQPFEYTKKSRRFKLDECYIVNGH